MLKLIRAGEANNLGVFSHLETDFYIRRAAAKNTAARSREEFKEIDFLRNCFKKALQEGKNSSERRRDIPKKDKEGLNMEQYKQLLNRIVEERNAAPKGGPKDSDLQRAFIFEVVRMILFYLLPGAHSCELRPNRNLNTLNNIFAVSL